MLFVWFNVVESIEGRGREPVVIPTPGVIHTPALPLNRETGGESRKLYCSRYNNLLQPSLPQPWDWGREPVVIPSLGKFTCSSPPSFNRGTGDARAGNYGRSSYYYLLQPSLSQPWYLGRAPVVIPTSGKTTCFSTPSLPQPRDRGRGPVKIPTLVITTCSSPPSLNHVPCL